MLGTTLMYDPGFRDASMYSIFKKFPVPALSTCTFVSAR
jgi:hypothetical protein